MFNEADYWQDHRGNLVPLQNVKDVDKTRDRLVREVVDKARELNRKIEEFKTWAMGEVQAFVELSAEQYGVRYGGEKGNIQLLTFDGRFRVSRSIGEYIVFDERLQVAKHLIDSCVMEWASGSRDELIALINHAFEVNKQGKINTERILSLRRLDIKDEKWVRAMEAIGDSINVTGSKPYIRVYERSEDGKKYTLIPLDTAAV